MKSTARRLRSDSAHAAAEAYQNAAQAPIEPPLCVTLRDGDLPFWARIIESKARSTWTPADLVSAAHLARALADMEMLQSQVDSEGYVLEGKINPAAKALEMLSKRVVMIARAIQVHALATVGEARDAGKSATAEREAREQEDDPLLPKLYVL
jgi:hypothetical protein